MFDIHNFFFSLFSLIYLDVFKSVKINIDIVAKMFCPEFGKIFIRLRFRPHPFLHCICHTIVLFIAQYPICR